MNPFTDLTGIETHTTPGTRKSMWAITPNTQPHSAITHNNHGPYTPFPLHHDTGAGLLADTPTAALRQTVLHDSTADDTIIAATETTNYTLHEHATPSRKRLANLETVIPDNTRQQPTGTTRAWITAICNTENVDGVTYETGGGDAHTITGPVGAPVAVHRASTPLDRDTLDLHGIPVLPPIDTAFLTVIDNREDAIAAIRAAV